MTCSARKVFWQDRYSWITRVIHFKKKKKRNYHDQIIMAYISYIIFLYKSCHNLQWGKIQEEEGEEEEKNSSDILKFWF